MFVRVSVSVKNVESGDVVTGGEWRPLSSTVRFNLLKVSEGSGSSKFVKIILIELKSWCDCEKEIFCCRLLTAKATFWSWTSPYEFFFLRTKWYWDGFFCEHFCFSPSVLFRSCSVFFLIPLFAEEKVDRFLESSDKVCCLDSWED
jgi:hypothetical protein